MNTLDSPLEALALNYLSYGFLTAVNNIWALIAVITAAVSFWRIRAISSPLVSISSEQPKAAPATAAVAEPTRVSTPVETKQHLESSTPKTASCCVLEREGSTKTKFSLYYKEDDFTADDGGVTNGTGTMTSANKVGRWCDDWERMMEMRIGDMGWYRWQDITALDGNVVRLWDGCRRRRAAALTADGGVRCYNDMGVVGGLIN